MALVAAEVVAVVVAAVAEDNLTESVIMKRIKQILISVTLLCCTLSFAEDVTLQLKNGSVWNGEVGQQLTVEYEDKGKQSTFEGELTRATTSYIIVDGELLFIDKIISITGRAKATPAVDDVPDSADGSIAIDKTTTPKEEVKQSELPKGVFVLPLNEMVGTYFRDTEISRLVDHVEEKYGLGQIIILEIDSGGGAVHIWDKIRQVVFEARDRHRFIAWIKSAGSGAAATAFVCDEIYYKSYGYVGAITMYSGSIENVAPDWQMDGWVTELESVLARTSHTPMIAGSMVRSKYNFSYDIDPETGEFTYYDHEFGDHVLSKSGRNMMLSPDEALHCGLSDGTADTGDQLAVLLDLEEWIELDTFGRDIAEKWTETLKEFEVEGPKLASEFQGDVDASTPKKALSARIKAGQELLRWYKRLGEDTWPMVTNGADIEAIKREIKNLEHQKRYIDE